MTIERSAAQAAVNGKLLRKAIHVRCCFSGKKPTKQHQRMIAVAGAVAEACWQDRVICDVADEWDWYDPAVMSESDWRFAGCSVGEPIRALFTAIDEVGALLRSNGGPLWLRD